ncbi:reverse transcriptase domain-containing protein [Tanacetum coccineum]
MRFPPSDEDTCHSADIIDLSVVNNIKEILPQNHDNSIEPILDHLHAIHEDCNNPALFAANSVNKKIPTPKLKELPSYLEYAFLDNNRELPAIISSLLSNQEKRLLLCEETNLVLNWEKCHFMVKEGIVLGHKISKAGIEVDKAKVDVIASLPYTTNIKSIRSFLGHAGFYRRFIKDFSKIARPMTQLLMKDAKFDFSDECIKSFDILRDKIITAPVIIAPNYDLDFELMCDASDYVVGDVLGQRIDKKLCPIYYGSKTMNNAHEHYTTTEKELLAVKFTIEIKDKKGTENLAADHLFRLENPSLEELNEDIIQDNFPDEHLMVIKLKNTETDPFLQLNQLDEFQTHAYEHSRAYKERIKRWHDSKIMDKEFQEGEEVLVFNSRLKLFPWKLRTGWYGPYTASKVYPYGTFEVLGKNGVQFKVNGHRLKKNHGHKIDEINETIYFVKT